jgi:serine/threonine protein kinase
MNSSMVVASRYQCVRKLGEGGFGAVYLAEDTRLGNIKVAVKECFDTAKEAQEQFTLEAELLANLKNEGLPRVTDHFTEPDGHQYLVMDFIEGDDLDERVRPGQPMAEREAARIMLQVCDSVAYLHTRRPQPIIHRDIKPGNIKITASGLAVLVDFGIAKLYHPAKRTVRAARAVTPGFSSPEQYVGKTDTRSDVYSLGATFYFLVTSEPPVEGIDRVSKGAQLTPPHQLNPALSPELEKIILQALAVDPNMRFPNANHLAGALRLLLSGSTTVVTGGITCPVCGYQNRPGARFCARDRTPLTTPPMNTVPAATLAQAPQVEAVSPEMLFEFANVYAKNNDHSQAIRRYETCLQQGFQDAAVYHNLGSSYRQSKRLDDALKIIQEGITSYPNDGDLQFQFALIYNDRNQPDQALTAAAKACTLEPRDAGYQCFYGQLLFIAQRYKEAASALERSVQLDPKQGLVYFLLGQAYSAAGSSSKMLNALQKAVALEPKNAEYLAALAQGYARLGRAKEARAVAQQALTIDPASQAAAELLKRVVI